MNNPTIDNDLQKAIDDITNTTNSDPIFADPVAAAPAPAPVAPAPVETYATPAPIAAEMPVATEIEEEIVTAAPAPVISETPIASEAPVAAPVYSADAEPVFEPVNAPDAISNALDADTARLGKEEVKEAALRDLAPILEKLDLTAERKFEIYKHLIEENKDQTVLGAAYRTAG
ncbi:MAG: hypothetical protein Q4B34_00920, partial [Candidatus Saccharibacteria bacterium]|nr:hypothetical protein [Candidatus Saccharibacteria bacterium]